MGERWIDVRGHSDYEVSSRGRLRKKKTMAQVKGTVEKNGYRRVCIDGKRQYLHRVVIDSFLDGDSIGLEIRHIDGDRQNNEVANLERVSRSENKNRAGKSWKQRYHDDVIQCKDCYFRDKITYCKERPDDFFCRDAKRKK